MPPLVLIQTMISNADMAGTLRSPKSQNWEAKLPGWTSLRWSQAGGGCGFLQAGGWGWPHHTAIMSGTPALSLGDCNHARVQPQTAPQAWGPCSVTGNED